MVYGGPCVNDRKVADRGVRIDNGAGHDCHSAPETRSGRDDGLRADRVNELKSERRYLSGDFAPQRIIAERDKAVPNPLRVEVRQNVVTAQYRGANYVLSLWLAVRTTNHVIESLGSDQFYHHFRVAARTDHDHRRPRWRATAKPGVQRRRGPDERDIHGKHF